MAAAVAVVIRTCRPTLSAVAHCSVEVAVDVAEGIPTFQQTSRRLPVEHPEHIRQAQEVRLETVVRLRRPVRQVPMAIVRPEVQEAVAVELP